MLINNTPRFYEDEGIWLEGDVFQELVEKGSTMQHIQIEGLEDKARVLALAYDGSLGDNFFDFEPEANLDSFLRSGRLVDRLQVEDCIE